MSDQNPLPEPGVAYDHLFDNVHSKVFFGKLAEFGYAPQTEKEAQDMLGLAGKLRAAQQDPQVKQAAADSSPFAQANVALDNVLGHAGLDGHSKEAEAQREDAFLDQAAANMAQDPDIFNSVLSLKAAEAEEIGVEYGIQR